MLPIPKGWNRRKRKEPNETVWREKRTKWFDLTAGWLRLGPFFVLLNRNSWFWTPNIVEGLVVQQSDGNSIRQRGCFQELHNTAAILCDSCMIISCLLSGAPFFIYPRFFLKGLFHLKLFNFGYKEKRRGVVVTVINLYYCLSTCSYVL